MPILTIATAPFPDQRPGTSGLRKSVAAFSEPQYLENFVQAIFDSMGNKEGETLVLGGDGRTFTREAVDIILRMASANGFGRTLVGRDGLLSTPALSNLVRERNAMGGIMLSASHNPGGKDGDFGVKFNVASGGPAPEKVTEDIFARTQKMQTYLILDGGEVDLSIEGDSRFGDMTVSIIDPVAEYADAMEHLFDFEALRGLLGGGAFRMVFDGMNAITGPYAKAIFEDRLGAPPGTVINGTPLEDFGGLHPDPNPAHAEVLMQRMWAEDAPDFGAASDGDGDRNMVLGPRFFVSPSDSLAILLANSHLVPGYAGRIRGVARSMPTSRAVDLVADALGVPCFETPTGWKFFGSLLDAGRVTLCGEESFGQGSDHVREKDGLWAVLYWLNIIAARGMGVEEIVRDHWAAYGRTYYRRQDYEGLATAQGEAIIAGLMEDLPRLPGAVVGGLTIEAADSFAYADPVSGAVSRDQGIRLFLGGGGRVVYRLSGTGTTGATLRVYIEKHEADAAASAEDVLEPIAGAAVEAARIRERTGRQQPSLVV